jgi:hypothetical protein
MGKREVISDEVRRVSVNWSMFFSVILSLGLVATSTGGPRTFSRGRYSDLFTTFFFVVVVFSFVTMASFFVFQDMMSSAIMYFVLSDDGADTTSEQVGKTALLVFTCAVLVFLCLVAVFYYAFPAYRFMVLYVSVLVFMSVSVIITKMLDRGKAAARDPLMSGDDWLMTMLDPRKSFDSITDEVRSKACPGGGDDEAYRQMGMSGWDKFVSKFRVFLGVEKKACPGTDADPLWLWVITPVLGIGIVLFAATVLEST